jgi:predicted enzyme related to lactoylglutathione lyase
MKRVTGIPLQSEDFNPSRCPFMVVNYRMEVLDALLKVLKAEGVEIDPHREDYDYRRFAWTMDPDGNRIELWEPQRRHGNGRAIA